VTISPPLPHHQLGGSRLSTAPGHSQQLPASLVTALNRLSKNPAYAGSTEAVRGAKLSFDRRNLATFGAGRAIDLWDVASGRLLHKLAVPADSYAVAFSPDGRFLANAASASDEVRIWEVATGRPRAILRGHRNAVTDIAISPDGRLLASGVDRTVRLWDTANTRLYGSPLKGPSPR